MSSDLKMLMLFGLWYLFLAFHYYKHSEDTDDKKKVSAKSTKKSKKSKSSKKAINNSEDLSIYMDSHDELVTPSPSPTQTKSTPTKTKQTPKASQKKEAVPCPIETPVMFRTKEEEQLKAACEQRNFGII